MTTRVLTSTTDTLSSFKIHLLLFENNCARDKTAYETLRPVFSYNV